MRLKASQLTDPHPAPTTASAQKNQADDALVVAFYLPQYHQIPENDEWWGKGFTDWVNVRRAIPLFEGHDQPRVPSALGYYDLRDIGTHHEQAQLAKAFGVGAFCYYAYWFEGRRLLQDPLELVAGNPDLAMPYAICWANETWSRRWDGSDDQILLAQRHSPETDARFIDDIAHHLADPRYVRLQGRPVLLLYRPGLLKEPLRTTDAMREQAQRLGLGELYLAMVQSFGHWEPISYGFDAAVEFPPHNLGVATQLSERGVTAFPSRPKAHLASYQESIRTCLSRPVPSFTWFRGLMPGWDNTPRRGARGTAYVGATTELFSGWLDAALECTYLFRPPGERLVFINAWNEWAEGAYLEPDESHGDARLRAILAALSRAAGLARETAGQLSDGTAGPMLRLARERWTGRRWQGRDGSVVE